MNKFASLLSSLLICFSAASGFAAEAEPTYEFEKIPNELKFHFKENGTIRFRVEENATTGYMWAAKTDPKLCLATIRHVTSGSDFIGAPGFAEIELTPMQNEPVRIQLNYERPWGKKQSAKTIQVFLIPEKTTSRNGEKAAPSDARPSAGSPSVHKDNPPVSENALPKNNPRMTANPAPKNNPSMTAEPAPKSNPRATEKPAPKESPRSTEKPAPRSNPSMTANPAPKSNPRMTANPAPKSNPSMTANPAPKSNPRMTANPAPKERPK